MLLVSRRICSVTLLALLSISLGVPQAFARHHVEDFPLGHTPLVIDLEEDRDGKEWSVAVDSGRVGIMRNVSIVPLVSERIETLVKGSGGVFSYSSEVDILDAAPSRVSLGDLVKNETVTASFTVRPTASASPGVYGAFFRVDYLDSLLQPRSEEWSEPVKLTNVEEVSRLSMGIDIVDAFWALSPNTVIVTLTRTDGSLVIGAIVDACGYDGRFRWTAWTTGTTDERGQTRISIAELRTGAQVSRVHVSYTPDNSMCVSTNIISRDIPLALFPLAGAVAWLSIAAATVVAIIIRDRRRGERRPGHTIPTK